jgi:hypothetical protein
VARGSTSWRPQGAARRGIRPMAAAHPQAAAHAAAHPGAVVRPEGAGGNALGQWPLATPSWQGGWPVHDRRKGADAERSKKGEGGEEVVRPRGAQRWQRAAQARARRPHRGRQRRLLGLGLDSNPKPPPSCLFNRAKIGRSRPARGQLGPGNGRPNRAATVDCRFLFCNFF